MNKFEAGRTYQTRSICDSECMFSLVVASRTAKFLTTDKGKRYGIKTDEQGEYVVSGRWSMAHIWRAGEDRVEAPAAAPVVAAAPVEAPAAYPTAEHLARVAAHWSQIAGEPMNVKFIAETYVAHASELACLRLEHTYNAPQLARARRGEVAGWAFRLRTRQAPVF